MDLRNYYLRLFWGFLALSIIFLVLTGSSFAYPTVSTVPDNTSPWLNESVVVSVYVDLTGGTDKLGAYTLNVTWDPAVLQYDSVAGGSTTGFDTISTVNDANIATGSLLMNHFYTAGADSIVHIADISFTAIGSSNSSTDITPVVQTLSAAVTFVDLKPGHDVQTGSITIPQSSVTLTSPNGGESWRVGTAHSITWNYVNVSNVKLEYSSNSGTSWTTIIASTAASAASYSWTIPSSISSNCLVKISDASNGTVSDQSDAVFTIYSPSVTVTAPNGSENWAAGSTQSITWASVNVSMLSIQYSSDGGTTWNTIVASTSAGTKTYSWTVPSIESSNCLVKLTDTSDATVTDQSDAVFSIYQPPSITVTSPNGGENWLAGSSQSITWSTVNVTTVMVEYSSDNGSTWTTLAASTSGGSYSWTLPTLTSANCLVKVTSTADAGVTDQSNAVFTIYQQPTITVTSPNGSENWLAGSSQSITWTTVNVTTVMVQYSSDSGSTWTTLTASTSGGSYSWTLPTLTSANCLVKVTSTADAGVTDQSNGTFTIYQPATITVTSPNGGENWLAGSSQSITWTSVNVTTVMVQYSSDSGSTWTTLASSTSGGSFSWSLPSLNSASCLVKVTSTTDAGVTDQSNGMFTIYQPPTIMVTSPNGGENWLAGSSQSITWSTVNVSTVMIQYSSDSGSTWTTLTASTSGGSYSWTLPNLSSANCLVKVTSTADAGVTDLSNTTFTIYQPPSVTVTAPNGGEEWDAESSQSITWTSVNVTTVKIEYSSDSGSTWTTLIASTSGESYSWTLPDLTSANCLVKVTSTADAGVTDQSNAVFGISQLPSLTLNTPNGGENIAGNTAYSITWDYINVTQVTLQYSTNNGTSWTTIASAQDATAGTYSWTVPVLYSTTCLVKIKDSSDDAVNDQSDAVFMIYESGLWGDVNNTSSVNVVDAQIISTYEIDPQNATVQTNLMSIQQRGDVNASTTVDITDALICATYELDSGNVNLPERVGKAFLSVAKVADMIAPSYPSVFGVPVLTSSRNADGYEIVNVSFRLDEPGMELGAVSARITWNPDAMTYAGMQTPKAMTMTNEKRCPEGELLIAGMNVEGENPFVFPSFAFRTLEGIDAAIEVEIMTASTAGTFYPVSCDEVQRYTVHAAGAEPGTFSLMQNSPNPFNAATSITFTTERLTRVSLTVFTMNGQVVRKLVDSEIDAGRHVVFWNGTDSVDRNVGTGVYLYRLVSNGRSETKTMLLLR